MASKDYKAEIKALVTEQLDKAAMLHYQGKLKGVLIIAIDDENVFRLMEGYGSDVLFAMNMGIDIAKHRSLEKTLKHLTDGKEVE